MKDMKKKVKPSKTEDSIDTPSLQEDLSNNLFNWHLRIYEEAWRQYTHEDDLMEKRNSKFLTIQTFLVGFVGGLISLSSFFLKDVSFSSVFFFTITLLYSIVIIFISILAFRFLRFWYSNNKAGEEYLNLRLRSIINIEQIIGSDANMGISEVKWRDEYYKSGKNLEGFSITKKIISSFKTFWIVILLFAISLFVLSLILILILKNYI